MSKKKEQPSFCDQLGDRLKQAKIGKVKVDEFSDKSSKWVSLRIEDSELIIQFDGKGEKIGAVHLYQNVIGVVETKTVWGNGR